MSLHFPFRFRGSPKRASWCAGLAQLTGAWLELNWQVMLSGNTGWVRGALRSRFASSSSDHKWCRHPFIPFYPEPSSGQVKLLQPRPRAVLHCRRVTAGFHQWRSRPTSDRPPTLWSDFRSSHSSLGLNHHHHTLIPNFITSGFMQFTHGLLGQRGKTWLTLKLNFPGHLCTAASVFFVMLSNDFDSTWNSSPALLSNCNLQILSKASIYHPLIWHLVTSLKALNNFPVARQMHKLVPSGQNKGKSVQV